VKEWTKAIPEARDRFQANVLVSTVGVAPAFWCVPVLFELAFHSQSRTAVLSFRAGLISLTFGLVVWGLRAATPAAAVCGAAICFEVACWTGRLNLPIYRSGLIPLMALFILTFSATRLGRRRKQELSLAEPRRGRNAAQIVANLGAAGLAAAAGLSLFASFPQATHVMVLGVFAEATADTVSSEIGAAFGGRPFLITTFRRVAPGTDGAVSLLGTAAGAFAAGIVVLVGMWSMSLGWQAGLAAFAGGLIGLGFDSLLGATLERRGYLGNDLVNFTSTVVGGLAALAVWDLLAAP
jgi:uncharacterized protein (TIGR00297 family)